MRMKKMREETGMSLVELIVAGAVSALLLGLLATVFANGVASNRISQEKNASADELNVVIATVEESARNAVVFRIENPGVYVGHKLIMKVHRPDDPPDIFVCRAWVNKLADPYIQLEYAEWNIGETPIYRPLLESDAYLTSAGYYGSDVMHFQHGSWIKMTFRHRPQVTQGYQWWSTMGRDLPLMPGMKSEFHDPAQSCW